MLTQHEFYVYYDGPKVYARMGEQEPVVVEEFDTAQEAHDRVQSIINPDGLRPEQVHEKLGFLSPEFQEGISVRCEEYVRAAYSSQP